MVSLAANQPGKLISSPKTPIIAIAQRIGAGPKSKLFSSMMTPVEYRAIPLHTKAVKLTPRATDHTTLRFETTTHSFIWSAEWRTSQAHPLPGNSEQRVNPDYCLRRLFTGCSIAVHGPRPHQPHATSRIRHYAAARRSPCKRISCPDEGSLPVKEGLHRRVLKTASIFHYGIRMDRVQ